MSSCATRLILIKKLCDNYSIPWVIIGDFNDLLAQSEKRGGRRHPPSLIQGFSDTVNYYGVSEIPMQGHPFTREKSRGTSNFVEEKLDRAMASPNWFTLFPMAKVSNEEAPCSDHSALLLTVVQSHYAWQRRFKFENSWLSEEGFKDKILAAWHISNSSDVVERQKSCSEVLFNWGEELRRRFKSETDECRAEMRRLRRKSDLISQQQLIATRNQLDALLLKHELYWKQRSKNTWLQGGDLNSKFFHASANSRKRKNTIDRLKGETGEWHDWSSGLDSVILNFYQQLFTYDGCELNGFLENVTPKLLPDACNDLICSYTEDEIKSAIFSMHPHKSPGPDGFNPGFYQKNWDVVGPLVSASCLQWLNSGILRDNIHATNLVLIPKKSKPEFVSDMRPIAPDFVPKLRAKSKKCRDMDRIDSSAILGVSVQALPDTYLGLPSIIGQNKSKIFNFVEGMVQSRLTNWKSRFLSRASKEIMLKSVVQALPAYAMSLFLIPDSLCSSLEKMMNSFWWGRDGSGKSGIHWKAWDRLCTPKKFDGMGFRKLHHFNIALLAKQGWRLLTNPNSLVARVYKARYYPDSSFLDAVLEDKPSYIWRSIMAAQHLVSTGARRLVGSGKDINIWHDPWLPYEANPYIESPKIANFDFIKVEDLLSEHGKFWDMDLIQGIFTPRDQELVKKISLSIRLLDDGWYWLGNRNGSYSVKSGYHRLTRLNLSETSSQNSFLWISIWNLFLPPKVKNLVWRILSQCLPTCSALHRRHVPISEACPLCVGPCEDDFHAMVSCGVAHEVWNISPIGNLSAHFTKFVDFWHFLVKHKYQFLGLAASICWVLWSNRNDKVWNQHFSPAFILYLKAADFLKSWQVAQLACRPISPSHPSPTTIWSPPASGYIKLNVDGAIFSESGFAGFGLVLRGPDSVFLVARNGVLCCSSDPAVVEALSIREALSWIKDKGWSNVSIETNSHFYSVNGSSIRGKYYLVDSGYPNTTGYLSPIKDDNVRYHIPDFKKKIILKGMSKQFNYRNSSLRTTIKRAFDQLKKRWKLLYVMPQMQDKYQMYVIIAAFTLHNFMRMCKLGIPVMEHDVVQGGVDNDLLNKSRKEAMNKLRNVIALRIWRSLPGNIELKSYMQQEVNIEHENSMGQEHTCNMETDMEK